MAFLTPILPFIGAGLVGGSAIKSLVGGGVKPQAAPLTPTRNDAAERAAAADSLARRTGARKFRRTPVGGAEAATGAKTSLLGRSSG